jgi:hypothetical protein
MNSSSSWRQTKRLIPNLEGITMILRRQNDGTAEAINRTCAKLDKLECIHYLQRLKKAEKGSG